VHIRGTGLEELEWRGSDDEDDESESGEESESESEGEEGDEIEEEGDEDDEEAKAKRHAAMTQAEKVGLSVSATYASVMFRLMRSQEALRQRATKFMGVSKDTARSQEDILSTPLPGEKIRQFYERSKQYWAGTAYESSGSRGKALRREGFRESVVNLVSSRRHYTDCEQNLPRPSTRSTSPSSRRSRGSNAKRSWMRRSQRPASGLAVWAPARADIGDDTGECVTLQGASGSMYNGTVLYEYDYIQYLWRLRLCHLPFRAWKPPLSRTSCPRLVICR
jgi:hypothetical protein